MIPAGFTHEYHVLTEICGSMNSGFLLLNQQQMIYSNASAQRLLRISNTDVLSAQDFDVRKHLLSIVAEPQQVHAALDHAWLHPEQEYCTDLALADAAVRWLRMHSFPVRDGRGNLLGRGILFDDITLERSILESRGETLALAAHELKTPLAIIKGCATTLLGSSARWDPAIQREMFRSVYFSLYLTDEETACTEQRRVRHPHPESRRAASLTTAIKTKALRIIFAGKLGSTPAVITLLTANNRNVFISLLIALMRANVAAAVGGVIAAAAGANPMRHFPGR